MQTIGFSLYYYHWSQNIIDLIRQNEKKFFCGFEPAKMHWAFLRVTNAFQDESWDLSNFTCYEGSRIWDYKRKISFIIINS